jgi:1-acyl-sn-glycerol-3-phosphate acyltransferase
MRRLEETIETASDHQIAEFSGRPYTPSRLVLRSQGETGVAKPASASLA